MRTVPTSLQIIVVMKEKEEGLLFKKNVTEGGDDIFFIKESPLSCNLFFLRNVLFPVFFFHQEITKAFSCTQRTYLIV